MNGFFQFFKQIFEQACFAVKSCLNSFPVGRNNYTTNTRREVRIELTQCDCKQELSLAIGICLDYIKHFFMRFCLDFNVHQLIVTHF